jgi:hypothetical protein
MTGFSFPSQYTISVNVLSFEPITYSHSANVEILSEGIAGQEMLR